MIMTTGFLSRGNFTCSILAGKVGGLAKVHRDQLQPAEARQYEPDAVPLAEHILDM